MNTFSHVSNVIVKNFVSLDGPKCKNFLENAPSSSRTMRYISMNRMNITNAKRGSINSLNIFFQNCVHLYIVLYVFLI